MSPWSRWPRHMARWGVGWRAEIFQCTVICRYLWAPPNDNADELDAMRVPLEVRHALRSLRRHWRLTLAATATLGLGIGAALTMAGIVEHVLLRPLPVREQDRILVSWGVFQSSGFGHVPISHATMTALAERTRVFERLAGVDYNGVWADVGRVDDRAVPYRIGVVTGELFPTLGVAPLLGRTLTAGDDQVGAAPVAVISEGLWQQRYGGDRTVLGKTFEITNGSFTIVGVAPGGFDLPHGSDAWVTFAAINPALLKEDAVGTLDLVGRLRPGRTPAEARRELDRLVTEVDPQSMELRLPPRDDRPLARGSGGGSGATGSLGARRGRAPGLSGCRTEPGKPARGARSRAPAGVRHPPRHRGDSRVAGTTRRRGDRADGLAGRRGRVDSGRGRLAHPPGSRAG